MGLLILLCFSALISIGYWRQLQQAERQLFRMEVAKRQDNPSERSEISSAQPIISVVIPAFNEEENIRDCLAAVVVNNPLPSHLWEVVVVDDESTDGTLALLKALQQEVGDCPIHIITGQPRPPDRLWVGKNWACHQGAIRATGKFLLFMDADVRLKSGAIAVAIATMQAQQIDLLTCIPEIVCGSLVEWLVQPIMFTNVLVSFNAAVVKDPKSETTYALGPFMLFRRSAYVAVGGHDQVGHYVAEDVALARRIKQSGFKLVHGLSPSVLSLRMYRNWGQLWEGWTKVLYLGSQRQVIITLWLAVVMLLMYTLPWLGLGFGLGNWVMAGFSVVNSITVAIALFCILMQYRIRQGSRRMLTTDSRYWWLQGISGILVALLAIASIIKTETGWGWTWRGRSLKLPSKDV